MSETLILIVEDSPTQAEKLRFLLEERGYQTGIAGDGKKALDYLATRRPKIVISDVMMPEMDGYALCRAIKQDPELAAIPVVLLTALADPKAVLKALEAGADGFITKPYDEKYLFSRIDTALENLEQRALPGTDHANEIFFAGERYVVTAGTRQVLDLLLSTYETAVQKNLELIKVQSALRVLNETLEEKVWERTAKLTRAEDALKKTNRALKALSLCNEIMVRATDEVELLGKVCETIVEKAGYRLAWVGLVREDGANTLYPANSSGFDSGYLSGFEFSLDPKQSGLVPGALAVIEKRSVIVSDISLEPESPWREAALARDYRSVAAFPLCGEGAVFGSLSIDSSETSAFTEEEIQFLSDLASDLGYGIMTLRTRRERKLALIEIEQLSHQNRLILDSVSEGIGGVDIEGRFTFINPAGARMLGFEPSELVGRNCFELYCGDETGTQPRLESLPFYPTLRGEPPTGAFDVQFRRKDGSCVPVECEASPIVENGVAVGAVVAFQDISEKKLAEAERLENAKRLQHAMLGTIRTISRTIEMRDPYTAGHQERVSRLAEAIARELKLPDATIEGIRLGGIIHDIGKLLIPAEILTRPAMLSRTEYGIIQDHARAGGEILHDVEFPWPVEQMIKQHHERIDGSGYPLGLKGDEIMLEAKILCVADVVESMASDRPYRPKIGLAAALDEIEKNRGKLYDPDVVDACLRLFREQNFQLVPE